MPEHYSLAERAWIPVASETGQRDIVRLRDLSSPQWHRLASGRADVDTALAEFLIGLLAISLGPDLLTEWRDLYRSPPDAQSLEDAFAPFADALDLDGDDARFFQDREDLDGEPVPVEALFIDAPADHFMVDRRYEVLSRSGAALALLTLQTMAPPGGAGHRTSLRGGGPLTTFVVPRAQPTLWQLLWANVPARLKAEPEDAALVFPWLPKTRTSNPKDKGVATTPEDVHAAQAFFGMPRRIRLSFEPNADRRPCDLTGAIDDMVVKTYVTRPWGANYPSVAWRHPLSPYYRQTANSAENLPQHLKSSRVGYRDWLGLVTLDETELKSAAGIVQEFRTGRAKLIGEKGNRPRILACGYALDNMKPLDFGEALLPLFAAPSDTANIALDRIARGMIGAAEIASVQLVSSVRRALFGERAKVDSDSTVLSAASSAFWSETERAFYDELGAVARSLSETGDAPRTAEQHAESANGWRDAMRKCALAIFDDTAPIEDSDPERIADTVEARKYLSMMFLGIGPYGSKLYAALGLAVASGRKGKKSERTVTA